MLVQALQKLVVLCCSQQEDKRTKLTKPNCFKVAGIKGAENWLNLTEWQLPITLLRWLFIDLICWKGISTNLLLDFRMQYFYIELGMMVCTIVTQLCLVIVVTEWATIIVTIIIIIITKSSVIFSDFFGLFQRLRCFLNYTAHDLTEFEFVDLDNEIALQWIVVHATSRW